MHLVALGKFRVSLFLSNNKILDCNWSKLKAFADRKINVTEKLEFVIGRVENSMGKGENAGYHNIFKRLLIPGCEML